MATTDQKLKNLLRVAEEADHELLQARDLLLDAFRVSVAGVAVPRQPRLEPELRRRQKEAPERVSPGRRRAGNRAGPAGGER